MKTKQDKGHKAQFDLLVNSLKSGGKAIVPFDETYNTTKASLAAIESIKKGIGLIWIIYARMVLFEGGTFNGAINLKLKDKLHLYYQTLKHLKPIQLYHQVITV